MKDILQYKNGLNNLELGKMSAREQDIFFYILFILSKNSSESVKIKFSELKNLIDGQYTNNQQLGNAVRKMVKKFQATVQEYEIEEGKYLIFNVLEDTTVDVKNGIITTGLKKSFRKLLEIEKKSKCYMAIDLKEMCNLKSAYLKILYRYLKQWDNVGKVTIKIQDFKKILDIPEAYRFYDIDRRILIPAAEEFKDIFKGLSIEKNNSSTKGKKIDEITFTWQRPEKRKKINKEIPQPQAASGAKKKYDKELALEQTSRVEAEVQELKSKENNIIDLLDSLKEKKEIENNKPWITENELENMYQEWIKIEGVEDNIYAKRGYRKQIECTHRILENKKAL